MFCNIRQRHFPENEQAFLNELAARLCVAEDQWHMMRVVDVADTPYPPFDHYWTGSVPCGAIVLSPSVSPPGIWVYDCTDGWVALETNPYKQIMGSSFFNHLEGFYTNSTSYVAVTPSEFTYTTVRDNSVILINYSANHTVQNNDPPNQCFNNGWTRMVISGGGLTEYSVQRLNDGVTDSDGSTAGRGHSLSTTFHLVWRPSLPAGTEITCGLEGKAVASNCSVQPQVWWDRYTATLIEYVE